MAETDKSDSAKNMPKGGRKGGASFPKIDLKHALDYSKKAVSKTHTGPMPEKTMLPGVFGSATTRGKIRASALKQFGLLEGSADAYKATKLAKAIDAATEQDRPLLLQRAFLAPKLFNQIFETLHGDTVSKARIEQIVKGFEVHPESAEECAQLFIDSAVTAGLGTASGDLIALAKAEDAPTVIEVTPGDQIEEGAADQNGDVPEGVQLAAMPPSGETGHDTGKERAATQGSKPGVTLNLNVDPSSDPDKLEKQLKLLRQFGLI
jgi:hypothetical protein